MEPAAPATALGALISGRYRLGPRIGAGGHGAVFAATHIWTGRPVAVKLLLPTAAASPIALERFLREARVTGELRHPNVVDVLDMGMDGDRAFLVLELLRGETLADRLARGPLAPAEVFAVMAPILRALAALHAIDVVHRDVKPDNVFLSMDTDGSVVPKLLDFGISKRLDGASDRVTQTGGLVGTPDYMSPEQVEGERVGPASDQWSVGVVMFEALAGRRPYPEGALAKVLAAIATKPPARLADLEGEVPDDLARLVDRTLSRDPAARFESVGALLAALEAVADAHGWTERDVPAVEARAVPEAPASRAVDAHAETASIEAASTEAASIEAAQLEPTPAERPTRRRPSPLAWAVGAIVGGLIVVGAWLATQPDAPPPTTLEPPPLASVPPPAEPDATEEAPRLNEATPAPLPAAEAPTPASPTEPAATRRARRAPSRATAPAREATAPEDPAPDEPPTAQAADEAAPAATGANGAPIIVD